MTPLRDLFERLLSLTPHEREAALAALAASDGAMHREVWRLLDAHEQFGSVLDTVVTGDCLLFAPIWAITVLPVPAVSVIVDE